MRKHILLGHGKNIQKHSIHRALYTGKKSHAMLTHKDLLPRDPPMPRVGTGKKIKPLSFRL